MIESKTIKSKSEMQVELLDQIKELESLIIERAKKGKETSLLEVDMKMATDKLLNLK